MKTIEIKMSDTIYNRLKVAGTKQYQQNDEQSRDEYLAGVIDTAVKQILKEHEVNQAYFEAVKTKEGEIDKLNITSTIT